MKKNEVKESLYNASRKLSNALSHLLTEFPVIATSFFIILLVVTSLLLSNPNLILIVLSIIVTISSVLLYTRTFKFAETMLSFVLGLFTIFSVTWDSGKAVIFGVFYILFISFSFMINAIKSADKYNRVLEEASLNYPEENEALEIIKKSSSLSETSYLSPTQRAESIRCFARRHTPINDIAALVDATETVTIISGLEVKQVSDFIYSFYALIGLKELSQSLDEVVKMPCSTEEFISIFYQTKIFILTGIISYNDYLNEVSSLIKKGFSAENIHNYFVEKYSSKKDL